MAKRSSMSFLARIETAGALQVENGYRLLATLVSASLFTISFPPLQLRPLAWIALVPLLWALRGARFVWALFLAGLWGMVAAYGVTDWLPRTVSSYYHQPLWLGLAVFLVASALMGAFEYVLFAALYCWAAARRLRFLPLFTGAAWVAAELGRARLLTGNPWALLGYSQVIPAGGDSSLPGVVSSFLAAIPQVADLTGVYGISFLIVVFNATLVELSAAALLQWRARRERTRGTLGGKRARDCRARSPSALLALDQCSRKRACWRRSLSEAVCAVAVLIAAFLYGEWRLSSELGGLGPPTKVAVVQGNLDLGSRWRSELYGRNLSTYLELTWRVIKAAEPQLVVWPENAMTFFVDDEPLYRQAIARVTLPAGVQLIAGAPRFVGRQHPTYFNSAFLLGPHGELLGHYDKRQLLPFAEYFPFQAVDYLRRSFGRLRVFTPGAWTRPLPTVAGPAGVIICNEAMFPRIVRERVSSGAAYLVNLSNDSWIADEEYAEQQFNLVSLRAIEYRRYLLRASTSGPSAIIDPYGRALVRTKPGVRTVVTGIIRPSDEITFYQRYGDAFALFCLAAVIVRLILAWTTRSRRP